MVDVKQWIWKLDMSRMTCINEEHKVIVKIESTERGIRGKIIDISSELFNIISGLVNEPKIIQQIKFEAENEFRKAGLGEEKFDFAT